MSGSTDTGRRPIHFPSCASSRSGRIFRVENTEARRQALRGAAAWRVPGAFTSLAEIDAYLSTDPLTCLLCGRGLSNLGTHLKVHGVSAGEYRDQFNLPAKRGLCVSRISRLLSETQLGVMRRNPLLAEMKRSMHKLSPRAPHTGRRAYARLRDSEASAVSVALRTEECERCGVDFVGSHKDRRFCGIRCRNLSRVYKRPIADAVLAAIATLGKCTAAQVAAHINATSVESVRGILLGCERKGAVRCVELTSRGRGQGAPVAWEAA